MENEEKEYIQYAKARGITDRNIMTHHLLRNAVPMLVTLWRQNIGYLIAGTAIAETIFSIPGIGIDLVLQGYETMVWFDTGTSGAFEP